MFVLFVMQSYLIEVRGLKQFGKIKALEKELESYLIEVRGLKQLSSDREENEYESYLIEVRGLKRILDILMFYI